MVNIKNVSLEMRRTAIKHALAQYFMRAVINCRFKFDQH